MAPTFSDYIDQLDLQLSDASNADIPNSTIKEFFARNKALVSDAVSVSRDASALAPQFRDKTLASLKTIFQSLGTLAQIINDDYDSKAKEFLENCGILENLISSELIPPLENVFKSINQYDQQLEELHDNKLKALEKDINKYKLVLESCVKSVEEQAKTAKESCDQRQVNLQLAQQRLDEAKTKNDPTFNFTGMEDIAVLLQQLLGELKAAAQNFSAVEKEYQKAQEDASRTQTKLDEFKKTQALLEDATGAVPSTFTAIDRLRQELKEYGNVPLRIKESFGELLKGEIEQIKNQAQTNPLNKIEIVRNILKILDIGLVDVTLLPESGKVLDLLLEVDGAETVQNKLANEVKALREKENAIKDKDVHLSFDENAHSRTAAESAGSS